MRPRQLSASIAVLLCMFGATANAEAQLVSADPLTVVVDTADVDRFAKLWEKTAGHPTAAAIESDYIRGAGTGLKLFIPIRHVSAAWIHEQIEAHNEFYREAIDKCLPWAKASTADLRSIYLGLRGLLPERPLPQIYVVIGRASGGGTAVPGAQLLELESMCRFGPTQEDFRQVMRTVFAHETAHTFQHDPDRVRGKGGDPLLFDILVEGAADYVASLVTGEAPDRSREAFGRRHEAEIWAQFVRDKPVAAAGHRDGAANGDDYVGKGREAFAHWLYNGGTNSGRLPGWERDMGYWLGMQIAQAYVEHSVDQHAAIRELLALENPDEILRKSRYAEKFNSQ